VSSEDPRLRTKSSPIIAFVLKNFSALVATFVERKDVGSR